MILANGDSSAINGARQSWEKAWTLVDQELAEEKKCSVRWVLQANRDRLTFTESEAAKLHEDQTKLFALASEGSAEGIKRTKDMLSTATKPRTDAIDAKLAEMRDSRFVLMNHEGGELQSSGHLVILTLMITLAGALAIGIAVSVFQTRRISHALRRLTGMIQDIAEGEGDVTRKLEMAGGFGNHELGEVSCLFNVFMNKPQELWRGVVATAVDASQAAVEQQGATTNEMTRPPLVRKTSRSASEEWRRPPMVPRRARKNPKRRRKTWLGGCRVEQTDGAVQS